MKSAPKSEGPDKNLLMDYIEKEPVSEVKVSSRFNPVVVESRFNPQCIPSRFNPAEVADKDDDA